MLLVLMKLIPMDGYVFTFIINAYEVDHFPFLLSLA